MTRAVGRITLVMNMADDIAYFRDGQVPLWRKLLAVFAVAYTVFPLDVIPDFLPVIGWLDDIGVIGAAVAFLSRDIKRHKVLRSHPVDAL